MVIEAKKVPRAARLICVLAAGDIGDLLDDVERGAGRSAIRATRSLIEHQVNMHTVLSSDVSADRYMAHLELGPLLLRDSYEAYYLDRNLARSVKHVAKKRARDAQPLWDAALSKYGPSFARQWSERNIRQRSGDAGRLDLYQMFRFASGVAHGSSSGSVGHYELHSDNLATYSAGRLPTLVPVALAYGAEAYLQMLTHLSDAQPDIDVDLSGHMLFRVLQEHSNAIHRASISVSKEACGATRLRLTLPLIPREGGGGIHVTQACPTCGAEHYPIRN